MVPIIIDYKNIVSQSSKLEKSLKSKGKSVKGYSPMLIMFLDTETYDNLKGKKGDEAVRVVNNISHIPLYYWGYYNTKREIVFLPENISLCNLGEILKCFAETVSKGVSIVINIPLDSPDFKKYKDTCIKLGFCFPHIETFSPVFTKIKPSLILSKPNLEKGVDIDTTEKKTEYVIQQYFKGGGCILYSKLGKRALDFLKEASKMGIDMKDGSQKEITGELVLKSIKKEGDKFIYIIDIDTDSVESGEEENVSVKGTRYNFHSHPEQAYIRHSVDKAWPSVTDYLGYLQLAHNTIYHCVATIEGLYILSFSRHWGEKLEKVSKKFVDKNFDIDHKENMTPEKYVEKINNILFEGYPIYQVQYYTWNKADTVFSVSFSRTGKTCLPTEKCVQNWRKIYKK